MSSHTPGPWVIDWYDNYSEETGDTLPPTHAAAIRADGAKDAVCGTCDGCHKIAMADAKIIAAAPDLLAALEMVVDALALSTTPRPEDRELVRLANRTARAAIAKATT